MRSATEKACGDQQCCRRSINARTDFFIRKTPLLYESIEEGQFAAEPCQIVREDQNSDCEEKHSAAHFDGVKIPAKSLIKFEESSDSDCKRQKWNRQAGRIAGEQENALSDGVFRRGQRQNSTQDRPDAWRPSKGECEAHQESADNSRLAATTHVAQVDIPIQPPRERRPD